MVEFSTEIKLFQETESLKFSKSNWTVFWIKSRFREEKEETGCFQSYECSKFQIVVLKLPQIF